MTDDERTLLAEIAAEEVECLRCEGNGYTEVLGHNRRTCPDCNGMSTVARFPGLRRECDKCGGAGKLYLEWECKGCGGTGWLPIGENVLERVLEAAISVDRFVDVLKALVDGITKGEIPYITRAITLAALRALKAAVGRGKE